MKLRFKLKEVRIRKNMTYRTLAKLSGVSTRTIVNIEQNIAQKVPMITLLKIVKILEVKAEDLYEIDESE